MSDCLSPWCSTTILLNEGIHLEVSSNLCMYVGESVKFKPTEHKKKMVDFIKNGSKNAF